MGSPVAIIGNASSRNYLLNGAMDFCQRIIPGVGFTLTSSPQFFMDRWASYYVGGWSGAIQIGQTGAGSQVPTDNLSRYALNIYGVPSSTSDSLISYQYVEGVSARDLAGNNASVGFWVLAQNTTCKVKLQLFYPSAEDSWGTNTNFYTSSFSATLPVGVWSYVSFNNIPIPTNANNGLGVQIVVSNFGATGIAFTGALITEVMLNLGPAANRFKRANPNILSELQACQRYCWAPFHRDAGAGSGGGQSVIPASAAGTAGVAIGNFPVTMRIPPGTIHAGNPNDFYFTPSSGSSSIISNFVGDQRTTNIGYFSSFGVANVGSFITGAITIRTSNGTWYYDAEIT